MAITWSSVGGSGGYTAVKGVCTSGSESAPTGSDGMSLAVTSSYGPPVGTFRVTFEAAGALTSGGTLRCYLKNGISGVWARAPDLDITCNITDNQVSSGAFEVGPCIDRIAFIPNGMGVAGDLYIIGMPWPRR